MKISSNLVRQGAFGSVSVYLDGRLLSGPFHNQPSRQRALAVGCVTEAEVPEQRETEWRFFDPKRGASRLLVPSSGKGHAATMYLNTLDNVFPPAVYSDPREYLAIAPPAYHRIVWTLKGVPAVSGRLRAGTRATAFCLVVKGDHMRGDLTGLSLAIEPEELTRVRADLLLLTLRLENLCDEIERYVRDGRGAEKLLSDFGGDGAASLELSAAGFSIFSESLKFDLTGLKRRARQLREWFDRRSLMGDAQEALEAWLDFVGRELARVRRDIEDQPEILL